MKKAFLKKIAKEMVKKGEAENWKDCYKELVENKEEIFNGMAAELRKSGCKPDGKGPSSISSRES